MTETFKKTRKRQYCLGILCNRRNRDPVQQTKQRPFVADTNFLQQTKQRPFVADTTFLQQTKQRPFVADTTFCNRRNRDLSLPHNRCASRTNASSLVHNRSTKDIPWKHCATDEIEYLLCHTTGARLEQTRVGAYTTNLQQKFLGNTVQR